jgi:hypothetical protein
MNPTCPKNDSSKPSTSFACAACISLSAYGWQRIAPCPNTIMERVRMFAPSTVMPIGTAW